jgi:hypothetical protein
MRRVPTICTPRIDEILVDTAVAVVILLVTKLGIDGAFRQPPGATHLPAWATPPIGRADGAS